jgi:protein phosphatase 2C family protein 2/3
MVSPTTHISSISFRESHTDSSILAEFRGPGVHHRYDDSPEDFDMDIDHRTQSFDGLGSRIIFLGDGTENSSDPADHDSEMFDHDDEDADLDMQVNRGQVEESEENADPIFSMERSQREGTPGPTPAPHPETPSTTGGSSKAKANAESPSSVATERSEQTEKMSKETPETGSISSKSEGTSEAKIMPTSDGMLPTEEQETS